MPKSWEPFWSDFDRNSAFQKLCPPAPAGHGGGTFAKLMVRKQPLLLSIKDMRASLRGWDHRQTRGLQLLSSF